MVEGFGFYLVSMTAASGPFLGAVYYLNQLGDKQFTDYGFFGLSVLLGGLVCFYAVNCFIAYLAFGRGQQSQAEKIRAEFEMKLKEAEDRRKDAELEAKLNREKVELQLAKEKQAAELRVMEKKEFSAIEDAERRSRIEAEAEKQRQDFKALGDILNQDLSTRLRGTRPNNLS